MEKALAALAKLGWETALAVAAIVAAAAVFREWRRRDAAAKEIPNAEEDYRKAVASRDPDRIRLAALRLRELRGRAGGDA